MSWKKVKLGDLLEYYSVRAKDVGSSTDLEFCGVSKEDGITISKYAAEDKAEEYKVIEKGCFAYNPYRINVGSIALMQEDKKGLISPAYVLFKPKPNSIIPKLLLKYLKSAEGLRQIKQNARGTVRQALRFEDLCKIEITLPKYEEQLELYNNLELTQNKCDSLNLEYKNQLDLLKKLRQQILQDAVQGKLVPQDPNDEPASVLLERIKAEKEKLVREKKIKKEKPLPPIKPKEIPFEIPENWVWCRGDEIAEFIDPQPSHRTPPEVLKGIPYISMKDISIEGQINFNSARKVSPTILKEHNARYTLKEGDFIFGKIGTIGKPVWLITPFDYTLSANLILIQGNREVVNVRFLFYFLSSPIAEKHLYENKSEMSYPVFGMKKARLMPVPIPPYEEQHRIVTKTDHLLTLCDELEQSIKQNQKYTQELLQVALKEALEPK